MRDVRMQVRENNVELTYLLCENNRDFQNEPRISQFGQATSEERLRAERKNQHRFSARVVVL